jgi:CAAX prenyl protease-like protein
MRWLERHDFLNVYPASVGVRAVVITSLLFGVEHNLWLAGIVAGLAYSFVYMRSGNLWSAVLAHATTNGLLGIWILATANWTYW